jgi:hypothetical protein
MREKKWKNAAVFAFFLLYAGASAFGQVRAGEFWYISNAAGLALEPAPSKIVALRRDYCLSMRIISGDELPPALKPYYQSLFRVDSRTLYEKGAPKRRQWIFRDENGGSRFVAAASLKNSGEETLEFIEVYENGLLIEEKQFSENEEIVIRSFYKNRMLEKTETRVKSFFHNRRNKRIRRNRN